MQPAAGKVSTASLQRHVIDIASFYGNRTTVNTYDEYGIPGAGNFGLFRYTGQAWLADLGLYYYKARMYSPTLGRFMQTDPIGYKDDVNLDTRPLPPDRPDRV